jgi:hypothetical protein
LAVPLLAFEDVGLSDTSPDDRVWRLCQQSQWVLITGNRNSRGQNSLTQTIQRENATDSLPVITIGDPKQVMGSPSYVERLTGKLLDYLLKIEDLRGAGRMYVP